MNAQLAGAPGLAIALGGAFPTRADFRNGVSRFRLSGGVAMFRFRHDAAPAFFWASTVADVVFVGVVMLGALAVLLLPARP